MYINKIARGPHLEVELLEDLAHVVAHVADLARVDHIVYVRGVH